MATLYTTNTGFRFPYSMTTDASCHSNLMFLEAQLDEYLHEHSVDASNVPWVTHKGIRLPYDKSYRFLDQNMKAIEVQLEQYLHEHEIAAGAGSTEHFAEGDMENMGFGPNGNEVPYWRIITGTMTFYWPSVGLFTPQSINMADTLFMAQGSTTGLNFWTIETTNPDTGLQHARNAGSNNAGARLNFGDQVTNMHTQIGPVGFDIVEADEWTLTFRLAMSGSVSAVDERIAINVWTSDGSTTATPYSTELTPAANNGSYETVTFPFTFTSGTYNAAHTMFSIDINYFHDGEESTFPNIDVDDVSITKDGGPATLFINDVGFRFPYQDNRKTGALDANMKFLETQISQYLHKHEVEA